MNQTNTPNNAGSATGIDLAALEQLARAAEHDGQHIYIHPRDSNKHADNLAWHNAAAPEVFLHLIALARATPQHPSKPATSIRTLKFVELMNAWRTADPLQGPAAYDAITAHIDALLAATPQHPDLDAEVEELAMKHVAVGWAQFKGIDPDADYRRTAQFERLKAFAADLLSRRATPQHSVTEQASGNGWMAMPTDPGMYWRCDPVSGAEYPPSIIEVVVSPGGPLAMVAHGAQLGFGFAGDKFYPIDANDTRWLKIDQPMPPTDRNEPIAFSCKKRATAGAAAWFQTCQSHCGDNDACPAARAQPLASTAATQPEQASERTLTVFIEAAQETLMSYRMSNMVRSDGDSSEAYPLIDLLSTEGESIATGRNEIELIVDEIYSAVRAALAILASTAASEQVNTQCDNCDGKGGWITAEWTDPISGPESTGERCEVCMGTGVEPAASEQQAGCRPGLLNADELAALRRFDECAQDGEGYDVPQEMMQRLAEIGVVRRKSGRYYQATEFGQAMLAATPDIATTVAPDPVNGMRCDKSGMLCGATNCCPKAAPDTATTAASESTEQVRANFENWYLTHIEGAQIGSRDCAIRWSAWLAGSTGFYKAPSDWKIAAMPWGEAVTTAADQQGDTASASKMPPVGTAEYMRARWHGDVPAQQGAAQAQAGDAARDAARYRFVKSMSKETLLAWRGVYGCADEAVDAAMAAPATSNGENNG